MGLEKSDKKTYLRVGRGRICQTVSQHTPGAIAVDIKDDDGNVTKTRYELQFSSISGIVKNVRIQPSNKPEFPDSLVVEIEDGIDLYYLQISVDSALSNKLINKFCNPAINWNDPIRISPYYFEDSHSAAIVVEQNGQKIEPFFTQKDPKGMPQIPEAILKIDKKDRTSRQKNEIKKIMVDITAFLQDYFADNVVPIIRRESVSTTPEKPQTQSEKGKDEEDDLPF
jgi:hypothetical protein